MSRSVLSSDLNLDARTLANEWKKARCAPKRKREEQIESVPSIETHRADGIVKITNAYPKNGLDYRLWRRMNIHPHIIHGLVKNGFTHPTPAQAQALPKILQQKFWRQSYFLNHSQETDSLDVAVAAETGSGKTLIFTIPILQLVLAREPLVSDLNRSNVDAPSTKQVSDGALCVVITPTRELALQISNQMKAMVDDSNIPLRLNVLTGGLSLQKQERLLEKRPNVIISTPGRLWKMLENGGDTYIQNTVSKNLSLLVLDEADKLLETAKFASLRDIVHRVCNFEPIQNCQLNDSGITYLGETLGTSTNETEKIECVHDSSQHRRPHFFFTSATIMLQNRDVHGLIRSRLGIDLRKNSFIFDFSPRNYVSVSLTQSLCNCTQRDRDLVLYYFIRVLSSKVGKCVVFVNAVSCARRLKTILGILLEPLRIPVVTIHSDLIQKQRMVQLEQFVRSTNGVMIATDITARGIDIPSVKCVVHYQVPRDITTYIHRCGRATRCGEAGFSFMIITPSEHHLYETLKEKLLYETQRTKQCKSSQNSPVRNPFRRLHINPTLTNMYRSHVRLAEEYDTARHALDKFLTELRWTKTSEDSNQEKVHSKMRRAQILLDEDEADEANANISIKRKKLKRDVAVLKSKVWHAVNTPSVTGKGAYIHSPAQRSQLAGVQTQLSRLEDILVQGGIFETPNAS